MDEMAVVCCPSRLRVEGRSDEFWRLLYALEAASPATCAIEGFSEEMIHFFNH